MAREDGIPTDMPSDVRVVVAEDDRGTRLVLRGLLRSLGVRDFAECANGAEAFVQIQRSAPDILISDWEMPEVSGIALTRLVRNHPDSPNPLMPVIMLTSHSNHQLVERARDAGVTAFLAKPVSRKALAARLEAAVHRSRCYVLTRRFFGPDRRRAQAGAASAAKPLAVGQFPGQPPGQPPEGRSQPPNADLDAAGDAFLIDPAPLAAAAGMPPGLVRPSPLSRAILTRVRAKRIDLVAADRSRLEIVRDGLLKSGNPERLAAVLIDTVDQIRQSVGLSHPLVQRVWSSLAAIRDRVDPADVRSLDILHLHAHTIERLLDLAGQPDRRLAETTVAELETAVAKLFPPLRA
ncbi:response regulator [Skermanella mucosa]|uniref:response regulator n=1 Tax=Skermanella mucosa TaxID=1789672 RepID=UPI00192C7772|nr:response regulator [Skermanella mucosa]UEM20022.1 response regulator [Skermanella mucosa]